MESVMKYVFIFLFTHCVFINKYFMPNPVSYLHHYYCIKSAVCVL